MVQKTSWEGQFTRKLKKNKGALRRKGIGTAFYTRYADRRNKKGLQIVKNKKFANFVMDANGKLIAIEPKYRNWNSNDKTAEKTYNQKIKKEIQKMINKRKSLKRLVVRHG